MSEFNTLFYDIETGLLSADIFSLGEQVVRHNQLHKHTLYTPILTISYAINNGPVKSLVAPAGYDNKKMIIEFDDIIKSSDVVIGKNNARFDNKHINTQRLLYDLPGMPEWLHKADDLERQFRKYFYLPSQSLDAISELLGLGGKDKMEFGDWQAIKKYNEIMAISIKYGDDAAKAAADVYHGKTLTSIKKEGKEATKKMALYNMKDVEDTRKIWNYSLKHFEPKFNRSSINTQCKVCGSKNLRKNGSHIDRGGTKYQNYFCLDHHGYAGKATVNKKTSVEGSLK